MNSKVNGSLLSMLDLFELYCIYLFRPFIEVPEILQLIEVLKFLCRYALVATTICIALQKSSRMLSIFCSTYEFLNTRMNSSKYRHKNWNTSRLKSITTNNSPRFIFFYFSPFGKEILKILIFDLQFFYTFCVFRLPLFVLTLQSFHNCVLCVADNLFGPYLFSVSQIRPLYILEQLQLFLVSEK